MPFSILVNPTLSSLLSTLIAILSVLRVAVAVFRKIICLKRNLGNHTYINRDLFSSVLFVFPTIILASMSWTDLKLISIFPFSFPFDKIKINIDLGQLPAYYIPLGVCIMFLAFFEVSSLHSSSVGKRRILKLSRLP
jgi:hypothetical protein